MSGVFNLAQLRGSGLKDWKPLAAGGPTSTPASSMQPFPIIEPSEESTMGIRQKIRDLVAAKPGITASALNQELPNTKSLSTSLSQMFMEGQLRREGLGKEAKYFPAPKGLRKTKRAGRAGKPPRAAKRPRAAARKSIRTALPPLERGNHIDGALAELRRRREGIDQAIAVLEALA